MSVSSFLLLLTSKVVLEHGNYLGSSPLFFAPHHLYFAPSGGVKSAPQQAPMARARTLVYEVEGPFSPKVGSLVYEVISLVYEDIY